MGKKGIRCQTCGEGELRRSRRHRFGWPVVLLSACVAVVAGVAALGSLLVVVGVFDALGSDDSPEAPVVALDSEFQRELEVELKRAGVPISIIRELMETGTVDPAGLSGVAGDKLRALERAAMVMDQRLQQVSQDEDTMTAGADVIIGFFGVSAAVICIGSGVLLLIALVGLGTERVLVCSHCRAMTRAG